MTTVWMALFLVTVAAEEAPSGGVLAPDDAVVFVRQGDLWSVRGDGEGLRQITRTADRELRPAASPDGTTIAYEVYDTQRAEYGIWTCTSEGSAATSLQPNGRNPSWSPDGGRLLFAMQRRSSLDIWLCNRKGTDLVRLTETREQEYLPVWSPDGDRIAFVREISEGGPTRYAIVVRDGAGQEQELFALPSRNITGLCWAPAPTLLFTAKSEGVEPVERIYRLDPAAGGQPQELTSGLDPAILPVWAPLGNGFVYAETRRNQPRLMVRGLDGQGQSLPGATDGDSEPTIVPGPARRLPQIYVLGRRSFYLPVARLVGEDVLVPAPDLAKQLGLKIAVDGGTVMLSSPKDTFQIAGDGTVTAEGAADRKIEPAPGLLAGVVMLPLRATAALYGFTSEYQPQTRVLRIGGLPGEEIKPNDAGGQAPAGPDAASGDRGGDQPVG